MKYALLIYNAPDARDLLWSYCTTEAYGEGFRLSARTMRECRESQGLERAMAVRGAERRRRTCGIERRSSPRASKARSSNPGKRCVLSTRL
jgi:hypothetical protein